jgi:hypothetical protein
MFQRGSVLIQVFFVFVALLEQSKIFSQSSHTTQSTEKPKERWECPILPAQEIDSSFESGFWWGTLGGNQSPFAQCVGKTTASDFSPDFTKTDYTSPIQRKNGKAESFEAWRDRSWNEGAEKLVKKGVLKKKEDLFTKASEEQYVQGLLRTQFASTEDFYTRLNDELDGRSNIDRFEDNPPAGEMDYCKNLYSDSQIFPARLSTSDPLHPQRHPKWPNAKPYETTLNKWLSGPRQGESISAEELYRLSLASQKANDIRFNEGFKVNTQALVTMARMRGKNLKDILKCDGLDLLPDAQKYCEQIKNDCAADTDPDSGEEMFSNEVENQMDAVMALAKINQEIVNSIPRDNPKTNKQASNPKTADLQQQRELILASMSPDMEVFNGLGEAERLDPAKHREKFEKLLKQSMDKKLNALLKKNEAIKKGVEMQYQGISKRRTKVLTAPAMKKFTASEVSEFRELVASMPPLPDQPIPLKRTSKFKIWSGAGMLEIEEESQVSEGTVKARREMNELLKTADCIPPISTERDYWNGLFDSIAQEIAITGGLTVLTAVTAGAAGPIAASRFASASRIASTLSKGGQITALGSKGARIGRMLTGKGGALIALTGLANLRDVSDATLGIMEGCANDAMENMPSPAEIAKLNGESIENTPPNSCPGPVEVPPAMKSYLGCTLSAGLGSLSVVPFVGPLFKQAKMGRLADDIARSLSPGAFKNGMKEVIVAAAHVGPKKPNEAIKLLKKAGIPDDQIAKLFTQGFFGPPPVKRFLKAGYSEEQANKLAALFKGAGDNAIDLGNALPAIQALEQMGKAKKALTKKAAKLAKASTAEAKKELDDISAKLANHEKLAENAAGVVKEVESFLGPGLFNSKRVGDLMSQLVESGEDSINGYKAVLTEAKKLKIRGKSHKQAFREALDQFENLSKQEKDQLVECGV